MDKQEKPVEYSPVDDELARAFIDGWNARLDHADFDLALHYWMLPMPEELKRCPFCGSDGAVQLHSEIPEMHIVGCSQGADCIGGFAAYDFVTREAAIAAWNTRPALIDHLEADGGGYTGPLPIMNRRDNCHCGLPKYSVGEHNEFCLFKPGGVLPEDQDDAYGSALPVLGVGR